MKLIVGLGNPGDFYADSRHNIGFSVVKALSKVYKAPLKRDKGTFSLTARARAARHNLLLAMPLTFMNLSGGAVKDLVRKYKIALDELLVVCDDLDLEFCRLKIRSCGSSAGHRGLGSVIDSLGSENFSRLRIGIGRPACPAGRSDKAMDPAGYVLSPFSKREKKEVESAIEKAIDCCQTWINEGITKAMNIFNKKEPKDE